MADGEINYQSVGEIDEAQAEWELMEKIKVFDTRIARPLFVYRMAKSLLDKGNVAQMMGARRRCLNASREITTIIAMYGGEI